MNKVFVTYDPVAKGKNGSELRMRVFIQEEDGNLYEQVEPKKNRRQAFIEKVKEYIITPTSYILASIVAVIVFVFGMYNMPLMVEVAKPILKIIAYRILWIHDVLTEVIYFVISAIIGAIWWIIDKIF